MSETLIAYPTHSSNDTSGKVALTWNGVTLRSLNDLRENFSPEALLTAHLRGDLYRWLSQHYYETEASAVDDIAIEDTDCLKKLCHVLGVDYLADEKLPPETLAALNAKKELLRSYTSDESIIGNAGICAMNQEELAELLDQGQKTIYLCENNFSIPSSYPGVRYIGIGNVIIDNAFTAEQYERAGITIEGIPLPSETTGEIAERAYEAAINNGYDDYTENHSPLAAAFHRQLKAGKMTRFYRLPCDQNIVTEFFTSRSACERARNNCIEKAYREAGKYFDTSSSKCIAREAADFYSGIIERVFTPVIDNLKVLCSMVNQSASFEKIRDMTSRSGKLLRSRFEKEITENADFYALYDLDYFCEQADIEQHDFRVSDGDVLVSLIESILPGQIQYTIRDVYSPVSEMEQDLNDYAATFFNAAYSEYHEFISEVEELLDAVGHGLPAMEQDETINDYIIRACVKKAM